MSTRQEYCAGSVSAERDDQGGSDARRHTIELGNDTHNSRDSNSDSDSNCDSGDDAMFEEVFTQLGLEGELEDDDKAIGPDPKQADME